MGLTRTRPRGPAAVLAAGTMLALGLLSLDGPVLALFSPGGEPVGPGPAASRSAAPSTGFGVPAVIAGLVIFALCQRHAVRGAASFRAADAVTLLRTTLLGLLAAVLAQQALQGQLAPGEALSWPMVVLAGTILLMDGLDGAVARAGRGGTAAGGDYDDVADSVVLLVLSAAAGLLLGWWTATPGLLKPLFVLGQRLRPRWRRRLSISRRRRLLGSAPGVLLLIAASPLAAVLPVEIEPWQQVLRLGLAGLGLLLVAASFVLDIVEMERGPARAR